MDGDRLLLAIGLVRRSMAGMDMGLGPLESFAATWVVMMAAMMLPYGLSCLGCSAALMVAMVLPGMSSLWSAVLGIVVLIYKFVPPLRMRYELVLSAALVALGVAYVMMA